MIKDSIRHSIYLLTAFACLAAASCSEDIEPCPTDGTIEVRLRLPQTRTALGDETEDGVKGVWSKGDKIALWAVNGSSEALSAQTFTLWHSKPDLSDAFFTAQIAPMAAGTYDYYAVYPLPQSVSGTTVSYEIPAVQDGTWDGNLDIMQASAAGTELVAGVNDVVLAFRHKVHALKIAIPEGRNLFGSKIESLRIDFPQPAAGRLEFDAAAPDAIPALESPSSSITINFAEPADAGDTFWVFVAPGDYSSGKVRFTAFSGDEMSMPAAGAFGVCNAGRITPVDLTIREKAGRVTWFDYTISDWSQLGEPVESLTLTLPDGSTFATGEQSMTAYPSAAGEYSFCLLSDDVPGLVGKSVTTVYESESAIVDDKHNPVVIPSGYTPNAHNKTDLKAPYLFFENFSDTTFNDAHADDDGNTASELDAAGLSGWTGCRWKVDQGSLEFRSNIKSASSLFGADNNNSYGRVDSPAMPLKEGKSVNVSVNYRIGATIDYGASTLHDQIYTHCKFGYTTEQGAVPGGKDANGNPPDVTDEYDLDKNGNPTDMPTIKSDIPLSSVDNRTRLSWFGYYRKSGAAAVTNATFYYYIDDIRVSISE